MTSVRKSIKAIKRKLKAEGKSKDDILRIMLKKHGRKWHVARYFSVASIRAEAKYKAFTRCNERKIKMQGKWAEYREFVAYRKRVAETVIENLQTSKNE